MNDRLTGILRQDLVRASEKTPLKKAGAGTAFG